MLFRTIAFTVFIAITLLQVQAAPVDPPKGISRKNAIHRKNPPLPPGTHTQVEDHNGDVPLDVGADLPPLKRKSGVAKGSSPVISPEIKEKYAHATSQGDDGKHLTMDRLPRTNTLTKAMLTSLPGEHDHSEMVDLDENALFKDLHNAHHIVSSNHINRGVSVKSQHAEIA